MSQGFKQVKDQQSYISVFCSLSNNSKYQLGAPGQTWQQSSMRGNMVDL